MVTPEIATLGSLVLLAAGAGTVHTLAGPDHYLPLIAVGQERRWSRRRALVTTALLGVAHCLVSVVFALTLHLIAAAVPGMVDGMAGVAAWAMIGVGAVIGISAWRRRRVSAVATSLLAVAFLVGPCEWLIPFGLAAAQAHGVTGLLLISAAFTACTTATMVAAVTIGTFGLRRVAPSSGGSVVAAMTCVACGVLMLVGI